jgi:hypothetical protein
LVTIVAIPCLFAPTVVRSLVLSRIYGIFPSAIFVPLGATKRIAAPISAARGPDNILTTLVDGNRKPTERFGLIFNADMGIPHRLGLLPKS